MLEYLATSSWTTTLRRRCANLKPQNSRRSGEYVAAFARSMNLPMPETESSQGDVRCGCPRPDRLPANSRKLTRSQ